MIKSEYSKKIHRVLHYLRSKPNHIPYLLGSDTALPPKIIYIVINSRCNLLCKMCDVGQKIKGTQFYNNMVGSRQDLKLERLKQLIDEVKIFKPIIAVTSTEPLLYKDLIEFSNYTINSGLDLQITTNGYLLSQYAEDLVDSGLHVLSVSLDGPPKIHNFIRGIGDSFERAYEGLQKINYLKETRGLDIPEIKINYSISNYNYHCLNDFIDSMKNINISSISFSHLNFITSEMAKKHNSSFRNICIATPSSIASVNLSDIDISKLWEEIEIVKKRYPDYSFAPDLSRDELWNFYNSPDMFIRHHERCLMPWYSSQIFANGDLGISTRCFSLKLGNIYETPFLALWNGPAMKHFRRELRRIRAFPACSRCCGVF